MHTRVDAILIGKVKSFGPKGQLSAYRKSSIDADVTVTTLGLQGDEQADLKNHGGKDKAIMHYAFDHYFAWQQDRPDLNEHLQYPGAFGENISTHGFTEDQICIGDPFKLGSAVIEVSQGRQPCWKLGHKFSDQNMLREVITTGRSGWYYRVLEEGNIQAGDSIELLSRSNPEWTVAKVFKLLIAGEKNTDAVQRLSKVSQLSEHWRTRAQKLSTKDEA